MGKGTRGTAREDLKRYGGRSYKDTGTTSNQARDIYYGSPSSQPAQSRDSGGQQRQAAQPSDSGFSTTDSYGNKYYEPRDERGRMQGRDRVHEVYRWMQNTGASPQQALAKDLHGGDRAYLQQLIQEGAGKDSVAYQGWKGLPNNVTASSFAGGGAGGYSGGAPTGTGPGGVAGGAISDYGNIAGQFQNFADTGGYSPEDLASIRSRATSPIRSVYSGARRDIDRQRALQGGYSPNRTAALSKMAREQGYATADANTNVEAALAQMVNQGRRYGTSGLASLYGTTPGLASTFGNQALQAQNLQNQQANAMVQNQIAASQLPGAFETTMGRINQIGGAVFPFADSIPGVGGGGGGGFNTGIGTYNATPY